MTRNLIQLSRLPVVVVSLEVTSAKGIELVLLLVEVPCDRIEVSEVVRRGQLGAVKSNLLKLK